MIWEITIIVFLMLVAIVLILLEIFLLPGITIAGVGGFLFAASGVIYAYTVGETAGHITLFLSLTALVITCPVIQQGRPENGCRLQTDFKP